MTEDRTSYTNPNAPGQLPVGPDMIDLFPVALRRHWHRMFLTAVAAGVLSFVVSLFLPPAYRARATIFVNSSTISSKTLALLAPQATGFAGMLQTQNRTAYLIRLLESERMRSRIIDDLELDRRDEITRGRKLTREEMLKALDDITDIINDRDGTLTIQVITPSAKLSADIANEYVRNLGLMVTGVERRKRIFIGEQMRAEEEQLRRAEEALKRFEDSTRLVALDEQTKSLVNKLADLKAEKLSIEMASREHAALLDAAGSLPDLVELEEQAKGLKAKSEAVDEAIREYEEQLKQLPEHALKLARLTRDARIHEKAYQLLVEQYKIAQISEKEEDSAFEIVDRARVPEKKFRPRKLVNAAGGFAAALVLATVLAIGVEKRRVRPR